MEGAVKNGHPEATAGEIFDLMAEFANYGFNKSHSAAYGLVSYQTAYLKQHYPDEFMAAIMTCDLDNTSKIVRYVDECRRMRIKVLPPDLNKSRLEFQVMAPSTLGFGLAAVKGIGPLAVEPLLHERDARGPYKTLTDLASRVDLHHKVGKKTLELLVQAGALDGFGISRPKLQSMVGDLVRLSEDQHAAKKTGQRGLFDEDAEETRAAADLDTQLTLLDRRPGAPSPEWLKKEKALLGVFLTGHPLAFHEEDRRAFGRVTTATMASALGKRNVSMVCVLAAVNERLTKKNTRMASLRLEDEHGYVEAVMFENEMPEEFPAAGSVVIATGSVDQSFDGQSIRFRVERVLPVEGVRQEHVQTATLRISPIGGRAAKPQEFQGAVAKLKEHLVQYRGDTPVKVVVGYGDTELVIKVPGADVDVSDGFIHGLATLAFDKTEVRYQLFPKGPEPGGP
jgi:DNA polymerase-3 subunit alpha